MIRRATEWGVAALLLLCVHARPSVAAPPKLTIVHFDVKTGDAPLIVSPDKRAVLIDAGERRGSNPQGV